MQFSYRGRAQTGTKENGQISAPSQKDAMKILRDRGLIISDIRPSQKGASFDLFARSVSLRDRILFVQELGLMLKAGLPLARAISDLEGQANNKTFSKALGQVSADIRGGKSFADALEKHPKIFPSLMVSVVRSGEASGKLVDVLDRLSDQMEKDAELRGKITSALMYPMILTIGIIAVVILIMLYVVPQLTKIFADAGVELPLLTRLLIATTTFLLTYGWLVAIGLVALSIGISIGIRQPAGSLWFDRFKIKIPIIGGLSQKISIARMANTMAMLLAAGLPLLEVLKIGQAVVGNRYFEMELKRVARATETGAQLSTTLQQGGVFPKMVANLLAVGEESGSLDKTFQSVADFYDSDVTATTRNLTVLLEPILMAVMGVAIGFIVASVLMPMYQLIDAI